MRRVVIDDRIVTFGGDQDADDDDNEHLNMQKVVYSCCIYFWAFAIFSGIVASTLAIGYVFHLG